MPNEALEKRFELSSIFESSMKRQIEITTVVYSFSKQAVKKIEVIELDEVKKEKNGDLGVRFNGGTELCRHLMVILYIMIIIIPYSNLETSHRVLMGDLNKSRDKFSENIRFFFTFIFDLTLVSLLWLTKSLFNQRSLVWLTAVRKKSDKLLRYVTFKMK